MDIKKKVQQQFGMNAEKYVTSPTHAKGKDLARLVEISGASKEDLVLDIATGGGHTANALAPLVNQVTALDLTSEILEAARSFIVANGYSNVSFVEGDAENLPFSEHSFDLVTCRIAPHHFPDIKAFVSESFRVLKPGGSFLLIDNTASEIQAYDEFYNEIEKIRDGSHYRAWKKSEWIELVEVAGYRLEFMEVFKKRFVFKSWCERMAMDEADTQLLVNKMLGAAGEAKHYFDIVEKDGEVQEFSGEAILLKATK